MWYSEQVWKIFGNLRKISKTPSSACLYNKKNITRRLEDMNFNFSWQKQYLFCYSKIKFISSRHRVISSIYKLTKYNINYYISICWHSTMLTELEPSFSLRPYGPDHYLAEAKRLKHKADSSVSISIKFTILSSNTICGKSFGSSQAFLFLCANSDEDIATYIG